MKLEKKTTKNNQSKSRPETKNNDDARSAQRKEMDHRVNKFDSRMVFISSPSSIQTEQWLSAYLQSICKQFLTYADTCTYIRINICYSWSSALGFLWFCPSSLWLSNVTPLNLQIMITIEQSIIHFTLNFSTLSFFVKFAWFSVWSQLHCHRFRVEFHSSRATN